MQPHTIPWHQALLAALRLPPPTAPFGAAVAAGLLAGVVAAVWLPRLPPVPLSALLALAGALLALRAPRWRWLGAALFGVGWLGLHAGWVLARQLPPEWERRAASVSGQVVDLPQPEPRRTRFLLRVDDDASQPALLRGRLLQLAWYDEFGARRIGPRSGLQAGARWRLTLRLRAPRGLSNPGGFDAEAHALAQRIAAAGYVQAPQQARELAPARGIDAWRERMSARIGAGVASPSARYVQALALGDTRGLDDRDWRILRAAGLTHLIAISGFHVGLVAGGCALLGAGLWRLWPGLGRRWPRLQAAALLALLGAGGYTLLSGMALPTVRTLLMIAVVVAARLWRRPVRVVDALALAAIAVLLCDPLAVLVAGFWLSFVGVAWLAWCMPGAGAGADGWRGRLREFLSAQGVATLGLLPLSTVLFGQASAAGPVANLLAIPWWSLVVVPLALVGTALEALYAGAGTWAWRSAAWCFDLLWPLFETLGSSRFALWWLPEARAWALPLALLGAFWLLLPRAVPGKPLAALLWLPLFWPPLERPAPGEVELVMIDVGQGLSVLLRTAHHQLLYDAGPAVPDGFDAGERAVVPALHALGVSRLDRAVISHGDNDHAGGFEAVRAAVPVARAAAPAGAPLAVDRPCVAGERWTWDGVRFRFLHPTPGFPYLGNESSCVLRVESAFGTLLLTGDIGEVIETRLLRLARTELRADVVLPPHHGSAGSSQPDFVAATGARLALISAGHGNRFGHPRAAVVERWQDAGAEVATTAEAGALRVWVGRAGLQLRERRPWRARFWDAAERRRAAAILSASERTADGAGGLRRVGTGQGRWLADGAAAVVGRGGAGDRAGTVLEPAP
ncbi:DNA internalization-related competence protein ComEC/Rec2 [Xanthomonas sp. AmX2]|uniref:DNA internalization-related competence protein ComEC/Rec2 n=1 Tax=Xanthomonas sp. TaxID=29446 RepID=UPI00197F7092|nr:DNA internalization-related competence protein ComEC/Rec2 [Xanthomonas sp.]MBN6148888.1 DNA internalization-related competence protein ComEC/Rec2 [Xanthomonas sp.]